MRKKKNEHKRQVQFIVQWIILLIVLVLSTVATGNNAIMIGTLALFALVLMVLLAVLDVVHRYRKQIKEKLILPEHPDKEGPEPLKSYAVEVIPGDKNVR